MKKFLALILTVVLALSAMAFVGCTPTEPDPGESPQAQTPTIAMAFTSSPEVVTADNGAQYIEKTLTATVSPATATQTVDWSVAWAEGATLSENAVTDYITVTPTAHGSTTAYVRCYADFGSDTIIITVATRDGGYTATCNVTFKGILRSFNIEVPEDIKLIENPTISRRNCYQLYCGNTYSIPLVQTDMFGNEVASPEIVEIKHTGSSGPIFICKDNSDGSTKTIRADFSGSAGRVSSDRIGWNYFCSTIVENGVLTITTFNTYMLSGEKINTEATKTAYYSPTIDTTDAITIYQWNKGTSAVETIQLSAEKFAQANSYAETNAYFQVEMTDAYGNAVSFKFWIESTVEDVSLDNSTMTFSAN